MTARRQPVSTKNLLPAGALAPHAPGDLAALLAAVIARMPTTDSDGLAAALAAAAAAVHAVGPAARGLDATLLGTDPNYRLALQQLHALLVLQASELLQCRAELQTAQRELVRLQGRQWFTAARNRAGWPPA